MTALFQVLWTQLDQTTNRDASYGTCVDSEGNVLVSGYTNGHLNGNNNQGSSDGFVSKYNSSGTLLWTRTQGGAGYDASAAVGVDAEDNVYVLTGIDGYYWDVREPAGGAGAFSILVSKYSPEGLLLNSVPIIFNIAPRSISVSPSGDVLVTGSNYMWPRAYLEFLSHDYIDSNGASQSGFWRDISIDGGNPASNASGSLFLNDFFYVTGCQNTDAFIAKFDMDGTKIWQRNIQASGRAEGNAMVSDGLGSIYVAGFGGEITGAGHNGGGDSFLAKYSEAGDLLWIKQFGTPNDDAAQSITMDSNGNIYVGGYTDKTYGASAYDSNDAKPFISVFNKDGELLWSEIFTATTGDIYGLSADLSLDNKGHVFAAGVTDKNINGLVALESSGKNGLAMKLAYITGTAHADEINGTGGNDVIYGLSGNDELAGGTGYDTLIGGDGNDTYVITDNNDTITEISNEGIDTVETTVDIELTDDQSIENIILEGSSAIDASGNDLANDITGNDASNTIEAGSGDDIVNAGGGNDVIIGGHGAGDDNYDGGSGRYDRIKYVSALANITINLATGAAYATAGNDAAGIGEDTLTNIEDVTASNYNDTIIGDSNANNIDGGLGNDSIDGGAGSDIATYSGAYADYTLTDNQDGTWAVLHKSDNETDTITRVEKIQFSDRLYTLNYSTTTITGTASADKLIGTSGDDYIDGLAGNDTMSGLAGNDTLFGGSGSDKLIGGLGDDTYVVNLTSKGTLEDTLTEKNNEGNDTIQLSGTYSGAKFINFTLGNSFEHLDVSATGSSNLNLKGNGAVNILTGNDDANTLDGGVGADTLIGGLGNDLYIVDNVSDVVTEYSGEGTDTVQSSVTLTLSDDVENLTLTGKSSINGTGNDLANTLTGNTANNILSGGDGADIFVFNTKLSKTNIDTIGDFEHVSDHIALDDAIFKKLKGVTLSADHIYTMGEARDANGKNDFIVYDTSNGALYYDADGSGKGLAIQFAILTGQPDISASDFQII